MDRHEFNKFWLGNIDGVGSIENIYILKVPEIVLGVKEADK